MLGDNVRYYRYKIGYTQEELAEKTDISPRYISDIENGRGNISLDTLEILGQGLKVEPYILLKLQNHRALPKRVNMKK
ncbi:MAG: helix-turn-helix transcriptional regulator [Clostridia bacterium]|nr:helix-turn-helix transcriptional regulator [Clostridia bacterium]